MYALPPADQVTLMEFEDMAISRLRGMGVPELGHFYA